MEMNTAILTITDGTCRAELLPFGATLRSLWVPDRSGNLVDVNLGYDDLSAYQTLGGCLGGTIGRCANRTAAGRFTLNGKDYQLTLNKGTFHAHGGNVGYHKRNWDVIRQSEDSVTFALEDADGSEGYPGNLRVEVTFTLRQGALSLEYLARADQDTPLNLTNHAYFNLAGQAGGSVADHVLQVRAERYTLTDAQSIPTGETAPVEGTPLDLRKPVVLGDLLGNPFLAPFGGGLDNNLILTGGEGPDAVLTCPRTGIRMEMETDREGVQVYTANSLSERPGKAGAVYAPYHGVCLETQHFPDAVNHPEFPSSILKAGEEFRSRTTYKSLVSEEL